MSECFICGTTEGLECHHVFFGNGLRQLSEKHNLKVMLCNKHHRGNHGVHFNHPLDLRLRKIYQQKFENEHGHDAFMAIFGRSYL